MKTTRYHDTVVQRTHPEVRRAWVEWVIAHPVAREVQPDGLMKIRCFADTDTLYISIRATASSDSGDLGPDMLADYDEDGAIVALTIEHASVHADLGSVDVQDVPHLRLIGSDRPEDSAVGR